MAEHFAGRAFGYKLSEEIYEAITDYREFPENLFVNVPQTAVALRNSFDGQMGFVSTGYRASDIGWRIGATAEDDELTEEQARAKYEAISNEAAANRLR